MSQKIEQYKGAKAEQLQCLEWWGLHGARYEGGGGGYGKVSRVAVRIGPGSAPVIYHQAHNGANNYHEMPMALSRHLDAAILDAFPALMEDALRRQKQAVDAIGKEALGEYQELLASVGLSKDAV